MKTQVAVVALACLLASVSAFAPPTFATRAVGTKAVAKKRKPVATKAIKKAVKKPIAKKAVVRKVGTPRFALKSTKGPPASKGYPSFAEKAEKFSLGKISGGGNKAPPVYFTVPDLSDPAKQIDRDPAFYAEAAKTRLTKNQEFAFDDGLTVLERRQRGDTTATFLTGSAKSRADPSTIRADVEGADYPFGLDGDRFQLLFISIFGLFTLVGCLSGNITF